jgi:hypothetical protein
MTGRPSAGGRRQRNRSRASSIASAARVRCQECPRDRLSPVFAAIEVRGWSLRMRPGGESTTLIFTTIRMFASKVVESGSEGMLPGPSCSSGHLACAFQRRLTSQGRAGSRIAQGS